MKARPRLLVVGIGNELRSDDGIGPAIARAFTQTKRLRALDCATAPENFLGAIKKINPERVVMVDACDWGAAPGEFQLFGLADLEKMPWATVSTHSLPLSLIGKLIRDEVGCEVELLGVQPLTVDFGEGLSEPVSGGQGNIIEFLMKLTTEKTDSTTEQSG